MEPSTLIAGIIAAATVINSGLIVWNFLQSPSKKNADAISSLQSDVGGLKGELTKLKGALENVPTKDALHELEKSLVEMRGKVDLVASSQQSSARSLERIENVLIQMAK